MQLKYNPKTRLNYVNANKGLCVLLSISSFMLYRRKHIYILSIVHGMAPLIKSKTFMQIKLCKQQSSTIVH